MYPPSGLAMLWSMIVFRVVAWFTWSIYDDPDVDSIHFSDDALLKEVGRKCEAKRQHSSCLKADFRRQLEESRQLL